MDPISVINSVMPAPTVGGAAGMPASAKPDSASASAQQFRIENVNNHVSVRVIDGTTGQVVQQISADVWLRVAGMLSGAETSTFSANG